jgi:hypothetical protein
MKNGNIDYRLLTINCGLLTIDHRLLTIDYRQFYLSLTNSEISFIIFLAKFSAIGMVSASA